MVDINLFKEDGDEGEEEKEWTPESDEEEPLEDALDEDFGIEETEEIDKELEDDLDFGDDIEESSSLDEEELLADEEVMPEFDTPEEDESDEDYTFGDINKKKTSPLLWVLLCVVAAGAALYQFVVYPQQLKKKQITSHIPKTPPDVNQLIAELQEKQIEEKDSATVSTNEDQPTDKQTEGTKAEETIRISEGLRNLSISGYIEKSNDILEHLSRQGQLGTIILKDKEFHVGYVSETPNASDAVGRQIKSILGIRDIKISPEERHQTAGKLRYWGVISGSLPAGSLDQRGAQRKNFTSPNDLFQWIKGRAKDSRLSTKQTESFAKMTVNDVQYTPVRVKTEGGKAEAIQFLASLKKYYGNYILTKLVVAPVKISDFNARQVRIVLDFLVQN